MIGTSAAMVIAFGVTWSTLVLTAASERSSITIVMVLCIAMPSVSVLKNSMSLHLEASPKATLNLVHIIIASSSCRHRIRGTCGYLLIVTYFPDLERLEGSPIL
jgi:hypothetical protein